MPNYSYVRICADDDGESHFEDVTVEFSEADYAPPAPPMFVWGLTSRTRNPLSRGGNWLGRYLASSSSSAVHGVFERNGRFRFLTESSERLL